MNYFGEAFKSYGRGKLIDIGCGEKLYADMIKPYAREHIGVDHKNMPHDKFKIDLFGTAYDIPVKDEHFDTVLCTAVLEHLEEPDKAIKGANRVLKRGGIYHLCGTFILAFARRTKRFL